MTACAILLVDLQNDYRPERNLPLVGGDPDGANAASMAACVFRDGSVIQTDAFIAG